MSTSSSNGLPLPPANLIHLVTGSYDANWFLEGGKLAVQSLHDVFKPHGVSVQDFRTIFDFGCGCGRIIRHWKFLPSGIYGCDYNPLLINWCLENLPFAHFEKNDLEPPLPYADSLFEFVYVFSVFTHLPEATQWQWIKELFRVLEPGGFLVLTTHGEYYFDRLSPLEQEAFRAGQVVVWNRNVAGSNDCGAYHPMEYVRDKLAPSFELLSFIPSGFKGIPYQDLYLFRKPL